MRSKLWPRIILASCCITTLVSATPQARTPSDAANRWSEKQQNATRILEQGRYAEAASLFLEAVQQAEQFGPNDVRLAESLNGLAQAYRYQQKYGEAEPSARRSLAILERANGPSHPALVPSLLNLAGVTRAMGRYAEAEQLYRRLLSARWESPNAGSIRAGDVFERLAECLDRAYAHDKALPKTLVDYRQSISESRLDKDVYVRMRDLLMDASLLPEAESLMQSAIRLYPDSRQLQFQLAEVYIRSEKYEKAIAVLQNAVRLRIRSDGEVDRRQRSLIFATIAQMNFFLVRFDDAFASLKTALELNPGSTSSRLLLGALYLRRNKYEEAAGEYSRVISADPRVADAHDGLAQVDLALGRYSDSVRDADRALAIDPGLQSSRYTKAMALMRDGRDREGQALLDVYLQHEAERRIADSRLAEVREIDSKSSVLLDNDRLQDAIELLHSSLATHGLTAALHRKLGLIQSRMGLHGEAVETLAKIIQLNPDDFLVHRELSREYEALGNTEAAQLQRVIYLQKYDAALQTKAN